jgi:hypothetical protein
MNTQPSNSKHEASLHGKETDTQNQRHQEKMAMHDTKGDAPPMYADELHDKKHHQTNEHKKEEKKHQHEADRQDRRLHKASDFSKNEEALR